MKFWKRRGVSSTVRRCIEKETGREFAAKIIDLSNEDTNTETIRESTLSEVHILRVLSL
jgi:phosphorylase kinase gamma subunit